MKEPRKGGAIRIEKQYLWSHVAFSSRMRPTKRKDDQEDGWMDGPSPALEGTPASITDDPYYIGQRFLTNPSGCVDSYSRSGISFNVSNTATRQWAKIKGLSFYSSRLPDSVHRCILFVSSLAVETPLLIGLAGLWVLKALASNSGAPSQNPTQACLPLYCTATTLGIHILKDKHCNVLYCTQPLAVIGTGSTGQLVGTWRGVL